MKTNRTIRVCLLVLPLLCSCQGLTLATGSDVPDVLLEACPDSTASSVQSALEEARNNRDAGVPLDVYLSLIPQACESQDDAATCEACAAAIVEYAYAEE